MYQQQHGARVKRVLAVTVSQFVQNCNITVITMFTGVCHSMTFAEKSLRR